MSCFFFFQAEDGIRDLVRSRGLGDVYKRQLKGFTRPALDAMTDEVAINDVIRDSGAMLRHRLAVSYTHLTLPTSDLV